MKHCRAKISILLLSILVIISLTACRSADNQTSATDNTPQSQETPIPDSEIILFEQETPSIYQDKTVINDNSRLDLAYRPVLEEVIPHATAIVQATVDNIEYTSIGANAWTVIDAAVQDVLSGDLPDRSNITIYAYGGYISMKDVATAEHNRERYTDMTDEELENTIIRQAADMQESPLVGQQYIFFLGAPTDDMPADAYEQLGWKFCQMLVGDDDTLYYLPYPAEDAPSSADTANDIAHITLNDLRELIHRYTS